MSVVCRGEAFCVLVPGELLGGWLLSLLASSCTLPRCQGDEEDHDGGYFVCMSLPSSCTLPRCQGGGDDDGDNDDGNDDGGDDTNYKATIIRWWMQQHFCASANRRQPLRSCWMDCVQLYMHQY